VTLDQDRVAAATRSRLDDVRYLVCGTPASGAEELRDLLASAGARSGSAVSWQEFAGQGDLPQARFVHLTRRDKNAQAEESGRPATELRRDDWRWVAHFARNRIAPLSVAYEDLLDDPARSIERVQRFLASGEILAPSTPYAEPHARQPSGKVAVSIVVVSHNEGENLPRTIEGIRATVADDVEIVVVDDWSTDGSAATIAPGAARVVRTPQRGGVAGARNAGGRIARGDVVVFADAHVDPQPGWLEPLLATFDDPAVGCAGPTITQIDRPQARGHGFTWRDQDLRMRWLRDGGTEVHEVPFICGCLMAFRRTDFEAAGGFDEGMVRWGSEDAEIGLHLWRLGRESVVVPESVVGHLFRPSGPYPVERRMIVHNTLRVAVAHLPESAVRRVISRVASSPAFGPAYAELVAGDVWARRDRVAARAVHDGGWFLDRFRIEVLT
jgi:GT2 family glycosyltransferase